MTDWNHASELLKLHNNSMWHRDSVIVSKMAAQPSVIELHNVQALHEAEERRARNRVILTKLLRSVYFLAKNRIPHTTTYSALVDLQIANGDEVLQQHVTSGPSNAQYTSSFSCRSFLAAIDKWLDQKLTKSLMSSPYFSILVDECQDVATCEELSICCRWLVGGKPEEHFMTILHATATDAATITEAISSFIQDKQLDYQKLVGQAYDGAAVFSGRRKGVQTRMGANSAHALYFHCACHRLQLASIQAAESNSEVKQVFGMMSNVWKLFYYSPKKAETLKEVQSALQLPEL